MQSQSTTPGALYMTIVGALEAANPSEGAADTANAELAVELAAYVSETYNNHAAGLAALASILSTAASTLQSQDEAFAELGRAIEGWAR